MVISMRDFTDMPTVTVEQVNRFRGEALTEIYRLRSDLFNYKTTKDVQVMHISRLEQQLNQATQLVRDLQDLLETK